MNNEPPEWIQDYYDGDVLSIADDPDGPIAIEDINDDTAPLGDTLTDAAESLAEAERQRIDRALKGAVLADYDGVDIHHPMVSTVPLGETVVPTVEIEPWHEPAPDAANGKRTERYTWRWFDEDRLREAIANDRLPELFDQ